jgi:hypothetical protein
MYVFMVVGLAIFKLAPAILHPENLSAQDSVVISVLGAFALLAVLGIRYPLKMLPLLFFEFVWKSIWVLAFGLPLLLSGQLDPNASFGGTETLVNCLSPRPTYRRSSSSPTPRGSPTDGAMEDDATWDLLAHL